MEKILSLIIVLAIFGILVYTVYKVLNKRIRSFSLQIGRFGLKIKAEFYKKKH